jgi:response regulator RpfG family c-di-GMP phosphodiesterase
VVLRHQGTLSEQEWRFVRLHTLVGERLLSANFGMDEVALLVRSSHERWDGFGYPDRLRGDDIPLSSRIIFVCGAFDDMTTDRRHRRALEPEVALEELSHGAGTQFDPDVVSAFRAAFTAQRSLVHSGRVLRAGRALRVLVAGADPVAQFLLRHKLQVAGHECVAVADGLSALESYQRDPPEVVICDLLMPQLDGVELCRRIRAQQGHPCYFVLLVAAEGSEQVRLGMRSDADAVLRRPVGQIDLEVTLGKAAADSEDWQASSA